MSTSQNINGGRETGNDGAVGSDILDKVALRGRDHKRPFVGRGTMTGEQILWPSPAGKVRCLSRG
jgi:hypothetical protein